MMRDAERSALNKEICRDQHSRQLLAWLVAYEEVSTQVWLTAYPNDSSNDSSQRASKHDPVEQQHVPKGAPVKLVVEGELVGG